MRELNPRTTTYEFLGPPGAFLVTVGTPFIAFAITFACSEEAGGCPRSWEALPGLLADSITDIDWWKGIWDLEGFLAYYAWYIFTVLCWFVLPGEWVEGLTLRIGGRLKYKMNGFNTYILSMALAFATVIVSGPQAFTYLYHHFVGLLLGALSMAIIQAFGCYASSFAPGRLLALGGNTGNHLYDWFIGRELNPRIRSFDIKTFNEMRPGMILWNLFLISMACEQSVRRGPNALPTASMLLCLLFQTFYIADALYNEPSVLTVMDVTTDGFGFMLSFGDLVWVPFMYCIPSRYLVWRPVELGAVWTTAIFVLHYVGYYIFRDSNKEKNDFRNGRNPKGLTYMNTERGTKLLTSGWWGRCRHPNYLGDLIMGLCWCLPTGFETPVTYFYIIYFTVLLVHRQIRDEHHCEVKYGKDWFKYKKLVPYRIVPWIY